MGTLADSSTVPAPLNSSLPPVRKCVKRGIAGEGMKRENEERE